MTKVWLTRVPVELGDLKAFDINISSLGWDTEALASLPNAGLVDLDLPAPPEEAVTKPGDLIVHEGHCLLCGNSSNAKDADRVLPGEVIYLFNSDPSYNLRSSPAATTRSRRACQVHEGPACGWERADQQSADLHWYSAKARPTHARLWAKDRPLASVFVSDNEFERMLLAWFGNMSRVLIPVRSFYLWGGYANVADDPPALKTPGLYYSQAIIRLHDVTKAISYRLLDRKQ